MALTRATNRNWIPPHAETRRVIEKLSDVGLAGLFLVAAIPKIIEPEAFADAIASYRTSPTWAIEPLAYFLPWFEGLCAMLLVFGLVSSVCRKALVGLLIGYTLLTIAAVAGGIDINCGCFGGEGTSGLGVILKNMIILLCLGGLRLLARRLGRKTNTKVIP